MAHLAMVTDRRDCKTFCLASCHFVSIFPRVFKHAICLFVIPLVFPNCTMVRVEGKVAEKPVAVSVEHRVARTPAALV